MEREGEVFKEDDADMIEVLDKLETIFDCHARVGSFWQKIADFKKIYKNLEKGIRPTPEERRRIHNTHIFAKRQLDRRPHLPPIPPEDEKFMEDFEKDMGIFTPKVPDLRLKR